MHPASSSSTSDRRNVLTLNVNIQAAPGAQAAVPAAQPAAPATQPSAATEPPPEPATGLRPLERAARAEGTWRRIVVHLRRIRHLQRIWHHLGLLLKDTATKALREQIKRL